MLVQWQSDVRGGVFVILLGFPADAALASCDVFRKKA